MVEGWRKFENKVEQLHWRYQKIKKGVTTNKYTIAPEKQMMGPVFSDLTSIATYSVVERPKDIDKEWERRQKHDFETNGPNRYLAVTLPDWISELASQTKNPDEFMANIIDRIDEIKDPRILQILIRDITKVVGGSLAVRRHCTQAVFFKVEKSFRSREG